MNARNVIRKLSKLVAFALLASCGAAGAALAQGVEAPSDFQLENDDQAGNVGPEFEADSLEAQAQAIESGDATPGLGRSGRGQVEEIVVQARRRAELIHAWRLRS